MSRMHRGTIFLEDAQVLGTDRWPAGQHVLRMRAPAVAERATPGSFVHVRCDSSLEMRRPMSVMRTNPVEGWFDLLFKEVGTGTRLLARRERGDRLSVLGPIGRGFAPCAERPVRLLVGGGVGIPPILFLAERLAASRPVVLMGSEVPFPFDLEPSAIPEAGLPAGLALGCLERAQVPSRTASRAGIPGCFDGTVTDLAQRWLELRSSLVGDELRPSLDRIELRPSLDGVELRPSLDRVELFACGPEPMLRAVAALGRDFGVPCQLALEERMACATGGCAGCTVLVRTPDGPAMKRVCVDGPVFDGASVYGA